jgi:hypothetical protein
MEGVKKSKNQTDSLGGNLQDLDPNLDQFFTNMKSLLGPCQDGATSDMITDQITGVLKRKINKNSKKTKEISLTLNHNNI